MLEFGLQRPALSTDCTTSLRGWTPWLQRVPAAASHRAQEQDLALMAIVGQVDDQMFRNQVEAIFWEKNNARPFFPLKANLSSFPESFINRLGFSCAGTGAPRLAAVVG